MENYFLSIFNSHTCGFLISQGHGKMTAHKPELILNNFSTRLGHTVGRMFASLFPQVPDFKGRQVCTLHNQRDFIFFRRHRYIFSEDKSKCELQELGPRFTLKLRWLQKGTFDTKFGDFEWVFKVNFLIMNACTQVISCLNIFLCFSPISRLLGVASSFKAVVVHQSQNLNS